MQLASLKLVIASLLLALQPSAADAIVAIPPMTVSMPLVSQDARCKWTLSQIGGRSDGAAVPVPALRIGSPVRRSTVSFTTGGGGTSRGIWEAKQRAAGLPFEPQPFNINSRSQPWIYTELQGQSRNLAYQRVPLLPQHNPIGPEALVYAQSVSKTSGRIVAVQMMLRSAPGTTPRYRLSGNGPCHGETVDIYGTSAFHISVAMLTRDPLCMRQDQFACTKVAPPHGRLLFVHRQKGWQFFEHRWVDFDAISSERKKQGA
ncbi:hypothetical protein FHS92_002187 [Sphingobium subterraneum]|uniref:Uncharacterized protein n=1 Tax=Sphingobium subterraneum TaxID=627688 RepID=A0A841J267_9SPHN|nr:hypothetical protein [Sphingobium subterraneum]